MLNLKPAVSDADLDLARQQADPLADALLAQLLGPWPASGLAGLQPRLDALNTAIGRWRTNADVADASEQPAWAQGLAPELSRPLRDFVRAAQALPAWADAASIERAETLFFGEGLMSCLLLFCASLPECYVVPDLAEVLQATAQLETRTEHRVRATAAMVFPVMMRGGLGSPEGCGRAQVLKVRLIHATVRYLLLQGRPEVDGEPAPQGLHASLAARPWDRERDGLPINQEELGYTLLTFGYVMLRSLRQLGVPHAPADEQAILHTWNVMGALVGVQPTLLPQSMAEAEQRFQQLQTRGLRQRLQPDPRAPLTEALMDCMAAVIPAPLCKPMPRLLTRYLLGRQKAAAIGLQAPDVPLASRWLFWALLLGARGIDTLARRLWKNFSLARLLGRVLGYRLISQLLMGQTRPLRLPDGARAQMAATVAAWDRDAQAPAWAQALENRFKPEAGRLHAP